MNEENTDVVFDKLLIGLVAVVLYTIVSLLLMIPIANIFIAQKIFGDDDGGKYEKRNCKKRKK